MSNDWDDQDDGSWFTLHGWSEAGPVPRGASPRPKTGSNRAQNTAKQNVIFLVLNILIVFLGVLIFNYSKMAN